MFSLRSAFSLVKTHSSRAMASAQAARSLREASDLIFGKETFSDNLIGPPCSCSTLLRQLSDNGRFPRGSHSAKRVEHSLGQPQRS
jgi:hypothetical protein